MTPPGRAASPVREYLAVLALGAIGAGLVLLALRPGWAQVVTRPPAPLPASSVTVNGQGLVPVAGALAWAALATLAAVVATRGVPRRLTGVLLAALGAVVAVTVSLRVTAGAVLAAAPGAAPQGGSVTGGAGSAGAGGNSPAVSAASHVVMASFPWRAVAVAGALLVVAAGVLVAWRGARWPVMSSRYERTQAPEPTGTDAASMWESLSRGVDPTEADGAKPRAAR